MFLINKKFKIITLFLSKLGISSLSLQYPSQTRITQPSMAVVIPSHGMRLRSVRRFQIDVQRQKEHDKMPEVECNKYYPQVSKKGTSHLFLWVCAHHMHCLGFHMIPGSEGCKDAQASLYEYAPTAPKCVMYDCACKLCEYRKAREARFFKDTQFYHDEFHGFKHKCPKFLTASRLDTNKTS